MLIREFAALAVLAFSFVETGPGADIPPGFDFPRTERELMARGNLGKRWHAWMVFNGVTQRKPGTSQPIFFTWQEDNEVFGPDEIKGLRNIFRVPPEIQFSLAKQPASLDKAPSCRSSPCQLVFFSPSTVAGLNGLSNPQVGSVVPKCSDSLDKLISKLNAQNAERENRDIPEFDSRSIAVKTTWLLVLDDNPTVLRLYDPPPVNLVPAKPSNWSESWKRCVWIKSPTAEPGQNVPGCRMVPFDEFFSFKVDTDSFTLASAGLSPGPSPGFHVYAILVGIHITTKEIPNWVWATFWWDDRPNDHEFSFDRPLPLRFRKPWRNYVMDVAYDMDKPEMARGIPKICFNPYLEGQFKGGTVSNCMTCHRRAMYPDLGRRDIDVYRGVVSNGDHLAFPDPEEHPFVRTDFLWSIAIRANSQACK